MAKKDIMMANVACAESALRAGCRFFAGYPITPQTEITEYLATRMFELEGRVFVQGESELASINMVIGASASGARAMTATSGQGFSLMAEGLSACAGAAIPVVFVDVERGGPGNCTTEPSQMDYNMATKTVGHGGFKAFVLAPSSVQETADFTYEAFDIADEYRCVVIIMTDGMLGHLIETVELKPFRELSDLPPRPWAARGNASGTTNRAGRPPLQGEAWAKEVVKMYEKWDKELTRVEHFMADDAETLVLAWGSAARVAKTAIRALRAEGKKVGLIRAITLNPFPTQAIASLDPNQVKNILVLEDALPAQFYYDVLCALNGKPIPVSLYTRSMGNMISPEEAEEELRKLV
jgi:2-oxoglutarate/2-oxoacid ferredoxin oxidoreductase subunit alpha